MVNRTLKKLKQKEKKANAKKRQQEALAAAEAALRLKMEEELATQVAMRASIGEDAMERIVALTNATTRFNLRKACDEMKRVTVHSEFQDKWGDLSAKIEAAEVADEGVALRRQRVAQAVEEGRYSLSQKIVKRWDEVNHRVGEEAAIRDTLDAMDEDEKPDWVSLPTEWGGYYGNANSNLPAGQYSEWRAPGGGNARRIVTDGAGRRFYTRNHYDSFFLL